MRTNTRSCVFALLSSAAGCNPLLSSAFCMLASVCSKGRPNERQVPYIHGRRLHGHRRTCIFGCSQQASRASDGFPMSSPHGLTAPAAHAVCVATIDRLPLSMPYRASPLVPMLASLAILLPSAPTSVRCPGREHTGTAKTCPPETPLESSSSHPRVGSAKGSEAARTWICFMRASSWHPSLLRANIRGVTTPRPSIETGRCHRGDTTAQWHQINRWCTSRKK